MNEITISRRTFALGLAGLGATACVTGAGVMWLLRPDGSPASNVNRTPVLPTGTPMPPIPPTETTTPTATAPATATPVDTATPTATATATVASRLQVEAMYRNLTEIRNLREWQKTIYNMINVDTLNWELLYDEKSKIMGIKPLDSTEITPIYFVDPVTGKTTQVVQGFSITREGPAWTQGHEIPSFYVRNPGNMQYGWMHNPQYRQRYGLTAAECQQIGFDLRNVGAGIPGGFAGPVEGLAYYFHHTAWNGSAFVPAYLGKLANQTMQQR